VEVDRKKLELDVGTRTDTVSRRKTQQYQTRRMMNLTIGHEIDLRKRNSKNRGQELELMVRRQVKADLVEEKEGRCSSTRSARQKPTRGKIEKLWSRSYKN